RAPPWDNTSPTPWPPTCHQPGHQANPMAPTRRHWSTGSPTEPVTSAGHPHHLPDSWPKNWPSKPPTPTYPRCGCARKSSNATKPAATPPARSPPGDANSTTLSRSPPTFLPGRKPLRRTCTPYAPTTTNKKPAATSPPPETPAPAPPHGTPPPDTPTPAHPNPPTTPP